MPTNTAIKEIMLKLNECTEHYPVDQLFNELEVTLERLSFSQLVDQAASKDQTQLIIELEYLLQQDVSRGVLEFVKYLAQKKWLVLLSGASGEKFLRYCQNYFTQMKQVRFITPIDMSDEKKKEISEMIRRGHTDYVRIIFEVNPSIMAGFIIRDSNMNTADYSLKSRMVKLTKQYFEQEAVKEKLWKPQQAQ